jgi:hypothetical protein
MLGVGLSNGTSIAFDACTVTIGPGDASNARGCADSAGTVAEAETLLRETADIVVGAGWRPPGKADVVGAADRVAGGVAAAQEAECRVDAIRKAPGVEADSLSLAAADGVILTGQFDAAEFGEGFADFAVGAIRAGFLAASDVSFGAGATAATKGKDAIVTEFLAAPGVGVGTGIVVAADGVLGVNPLDAACGDHTALGVAVSECFLVAAASELHQGEGLCGVRESAAADSVFGAGDVAACEVVAGAGYPHTADDFFPACPFGVHMHCAAVESYLSICNVKRTMKVLSRVLVRYPGI